MATTTNLELVITAKDKASQALKDVSGQLNGFSQKATVAAKAIGVATAALGAFAIAAGTKAVKASMEYEKAMLGLSTVARAFNVDQIAATDAAKKLAEDGLMTVSEAASGLKNLLASRFGLEESITLMNALKDSAAFNRQGFLDFGQAIVGATEGIKNGNSILVDNAGITKNLSVILSEAGLSANDLMKATTDASVRQVLYNGILKEASIFQGDAARSAETTSGAISKLKTSFFNLNVEIGNKMIPYVLEATNKLTSITESVRTNNQYFEAFGKILQFVWNMILSVGKALKSLENFLTAVFTAMFIGIDNAKKWWNEFGNIVSSTANRIISALKPAIDFINKVIAGYNKLADKAGMKTISEIRLGGKALGGSVAQGTPYVVGEYRPEVFVPSQSGNIRQMSQMQKDVNINFNNVSVRSDQDINEIAYRVKKILNREQEMYQLGAL